jgi:hypothetical protein
VQEEEMMAILSGLKKIALAVALATALAVGFAPTVHAYGNVTLKRGIVQVVGGEVVVVSRDGQVLSVSNGAGLLRAGLIAVGDQVVVTVVEDKGKHKHRGHVTILK